MLQPAHLPTQTLFVSPSPPTNASLLPSSLSVSISPLPPVSPFSPCLVLLLLWYNITNHPNRTPPSPW